MSEEQNINREPTGGSREIRDEIISSTVSSQQATSNQQQATENMEVHHHAHAGHGKKTWREYFWEFLMLFLAVFSGFLAEYQLEHTIEHQREKEYMITMLEDIKSDTSLLSACVNYWNGINNDIDSLADAIKIPVSRTDMVKSYGHLNNALNYYGFRYNDRTIMQLKNSGGFRLIREKGVANKIILYDQFNQNAVFNIAAQHNLIYMQTLALRNKVFVQEILNTIYGRYGYKPASSSDNSWIDSMVKQHPVPILQAEYNKLMFEFKNSLLAMRKDFTNMQWGYEHEKEKMKELAKLIQEKYHLE